MTPIAERDRSACFETAAGFLCILLAALGTLVLVATVPPVWRVVGGASVEAFSLAVGALAGLDVVVLGDLGIGLAICEMVCLGLGGWNLACGKGRLFLLLYGGTRLIAGSFILVPEIHNVLQYAPWLLFVWERTWYCR